jgi:hypothetical protein
MDVMPQGTKPRFGHRVALATFLNGSFMAALLALLDRRLERIFKILEKGTLSRRYRD